MKRTTYILIGLFASGLIVLFIFALAILCAGRADSGKIAFEGKSLTKELPPCRVLWLSDANVVVPEDSTNRHRDFWILRHDFRLDVMPSEDGKNSISYPEEADKCVTTEMKGDTLHIFFAMPMKDFIERVEESGRSSIHFFPGSWQIRLAAQPECIINGMQEQQMTLRHLSQDSLAVDASTSVAVDDCRFDVLNMHRGGRKLVLQSGSIRTLYLDLDNTDSWHVDAEKTSVETAHLTGSHNSSVELAKGECERIYWSPKSDKARLKLTLGEKACVTVGD